MTARIAFIGAAITGLLALILTLLPVRAMPVGATDESATDEPLMCTLETEGMLSEQAGKVCECVFRPAVKVKSLPDRFAWDCGILRPSSGVAAADLATSPYVLPSVVGIDRSRTTVVTEGDNVEGDKKTDPEKKN